MRTLAQTDKKIADLESKQSQGRELTEHFHLGMVGGSGKAVQRLNKRRSADLEKTIDRAVEIQKLKAERERLLASAQAPQRKAEFPRDTQRGYRRVCKEERNVPP